MKINEKYKKNLTFGLIPAREGSQGLKNKNIVNINNKELIQFTLDASLNSNFIDETYISTDSIYIKKNYSDKCQIIDRPKKFSDNRASSVSVVKHFISKMNKRYFDINFNIVYLQPTSPLRTEKHIDECFKMMSANKFSSCVSVTKNNFSPYKSFKLDKKNSLESLFDESMTNMRRQDLPETYRANGAIYIFTKEDFIKNNGFPSNNGYAYVMQELESIDIDSFKDVEDVKEILKG